VNAIVRFIGGLSFIGLLVLMFLVAFPLYVFGILFLKRKGWC